jgi:hypothetical protein
VDEQIVGGAPVANAREHGTEGMSCVRGTAASVPIERRTGKAGAGYASQIQSVHVARI